MFDGIPDKERGITVKIPLTSPTGKIRVKSRSTMFEYGLPCATRQTPFSQNNYIEWQIGYDVDIKNKNLSLSTLADVQFISYNGKTKSFYELSECLYYFTQWGFIEIAALKDLLTFLSELEESALLAEHRDCKIKRTHPPRKKLII